MNKAVHPVDAAWLRMDASENAMVITVVFRFDGPLDDGALDETLARLLAHRKFRQRPVPDASVLTRATWQDDPAFDLGRHVERVRLSPPGGDDALEALVGDRMSTPLERDRPLWHVDVVEGVGGDGSALVVRVHHAVGDGVALVRLLLGVAGAGDAQRPVAVGSRRPPPPRACAPWPSARARRPRRSRACSCSRRTTTPRSAGRSRRASSRRCRRRSRCPR